MSHVVSGIARKLGKSRARKMKWRVRKDKNRAEKEVVGVKMKWRV